MRWSPACISTCFDNLCLIYCFSESSNWRDSMTFIKIYYFFSIITFCDLDHLSAGVALAFRNQLVSLDVNSTFHIQRPLRKVDIRARTSQWIEIIFCTFFWKKLPLRCIISRLEAHKKFIDTFFEKKWLVTSSVKGSQFFWTLFYKPDVSCTQCRAQSAKLQQMFILIIPIVGKINWQTISLKNAWSPRRKGSNQSLTRDLPTWHNLNYGFCCVKQ